VNCDHYYTDPCWFNNKRSMVFCSDRENRTNLFRYDLNTRAVTQMTDLDRRQRIILTLPTFTAWTNP
jgi:Tol biopolymer transport system component